MIYLEVEVERKNLSKKNETGNKIRNVAKEVKKIVSSLWPVNFVIHISLFFSLQTS